MKIRDSCEKINDFNNVLAAFSTELSIHQLWSSGFSGQEVTGRKRVTSCIDELRIFELALIYFVHPHENLITRKGIESTGYLTASTVL